MGSAAPQQRTLEANVPALTILQTADQTIGEAPFGGTVSEIVYVAEAAVTGADSPASRTLTVVNKGQAGVGTTVVGTLALVLGVNLVAFDERAFTLSVVANATTVADGDVLVLVSTAVGGTGLVDPGGLVKVQIDRVAGS